MYILVWPSFQWDTQAKLKVLHEATPKPNEAQLGVWARVLHVTVEDIATWLEYGGFTTTVSAKQRMQVSY